MSADVNMTKGLSGSIQATKFFTIWEVIRF